MKRFIKLSLCIILSFCVLLSVCLIEIGAVHDCVGEDCQICRDIALQGEILKLILMSCLGCGIMLTISQLTAFISSFISTEKIKLNLVANKVKLTA